MPTGLLTVRPATSTRGYGKPNCWPAFGSKAIVTQPFESPDFRIEHRQGGVAWVEAVTANPQVAYNHVNAPHSRPPQAREEIFFGSAALRFAKTLGSKLQRRYDNLPHVAGQPFMIAVADFQAPGSMTWSREGLIGYLYGTGAEVPKSMAAGRRDPCRSRICKAIRHSLQGCLPTTSTASFPR